MTSPAGRAAPGSPGTVLLPPRYDASRAYPVVVFLPFTDGSAERLLRLYASEVDFPALRAPVSLERLFHGVAERLSEGDADREFILVLTAGVGRDADYATGDAWSRTLVRYEAQVRGDLAALAAAHPIDSNCVVLAGYSLGGDLAWALALRNPSRFQGAIVMGSRAGYRSPAANLRALADRRARFFFALGDHEDEVRITGARAAMTLLERSGIAWQFRELVEAGHDAAPLEEFQTALDFVVWGRVPRPVDWSTVSGGPGRWESLAAGTETTCGVATGGAAWCWGRNTEGSLGDGGSARRSTRPVAVAGGQRFSSLSVSRRHVCGLATAGATWCWGSSGAFTRSSPSTHRTPVVAGAPRNFRTISAGGYRTCGVTAGNELYCWGFNRNGELGNGQRANRSTPDRIAPTLAVREVSAGIGDMTCLLTDAGAPYCWGVGRVDTPTAVPGERRFHGITTGYSHACALTDEGAAFCWGAGTNSRVPVAVAGGLRFRMLDAGFSHTCGVTTDDGAWCWGSNHRGQLGNATQTNSAVPVAVSGERHFRSVTAGHSHSCGVTTEGAAYCWGFNVFGQLGNGRRERSAVAVAVINPDAGVIRN